MYLKEFLDDCGARGLTTHTIATYRSNLQTFLAFLDKDPIDIQMNDLRSFLAHLRSMTYIVGRQERTGVSGSTINAYYSAISSFYDFLVWEHNFPANPVPQFRKRYLRLKEQRGGDNERQLVSVVTMAQLVDLPGEDILARALMIFAGKTGLRKGELLALQVHDLNFENYTFRIPAKAKRTNRLGFLDTETVIVLQQYLDWREERARSGALWVTSGGYDLDKHGPYEITTRYAGALAIHDPAGPLSRKFTPHCFRHFFTTHLRRSGMPREFIQELRGDRRRDAIDIYDHIDREELRRSYLEHIPQLDQVDLRQTTLMEVRT